MEVIDARSALLSNFEVLGLLRELENEHIARTKTALRVKKEEEDAGTNSSKRADAVTPENLRTIQVEAIQYLSAEYQPTQSQSNEGIRRLMNGLRQHDLTKAEKLQVVNLAPTTPVELYVIVEELEDRLGENMNSVLETVQASLSEKPSTAKDSSSLGANGASARVRELSYPDADLDADGDEDMEGTHDDLVFDDSGEGAGIEGDLEMDDD
ncbi:hypothetical protein V5O48_004617 [Marasmius crinis-equi]|uniref:DNA-directed RNA polymerase III subunit RPC9 n=1 Tax=Marasmius crinis-equi TaxID=585013 RepID=A0ABR3FPN2_9AGAR